MRILFCCEFYPPSVGGVQEVMRQIAERLVKRGHDLTVATTRLPSRDFNELNGVKIREFKVSGNLMRGMAGEVDQYQQFVTSGQFDVIMIKAAQQWTFDALWPVLDRFNARKVFIPCGFSGLFESRYEEYFRQMPEVLHKFDHLIFYASDYRDINFVKEHGFSNLSVIPNGASEIEFTVSPDPSLRKRLGIYQDDFLFLTVGSFTGLKGQNEVISAYAKVELECPSVLVVNGNSVSSPDGVSLQTTLKKYVKDGLRGLGIIHDEKEQLVKKASVIDEQQKQKKVLFTDLSRPELVHAFMAADLFVFASNVEYSPLVLYESAAAGTPFLSVPVGNAEEIAAWTGGGKICPAPRDSKGYTRADPAVLAEHMSRVAGDKDLLLRLGETGKKNWAEKYTWEKIALEYEKVLRNGD